MSPTCSGKRDSVARMFWEVFGAPKSCVVLPSNDAIWYEDSLPEPFIARDDPAGGPKIASGGARPQWGICPIEVRGAPPHESSLMDCPLNRPFSSIGNQTGGRSFEAARRPGGKKIPEGGGGLPLDRFSMTGGQVNEILGAVKNHALARFTSSYTVWFALTPSASPRKHKLEVKLAPKISGKVNDGKRDAIY